MRKVIFWPVSDCVSIDKANHKRLIAIVAGLAGVIVFDDEENHWRICYSNGAITPNFASLSLLVNSLPHPFNIYEV